MRVKLGAWVKAAAGSLNVDSPQSRSHSDPTLLSHLLHKVDFF